MTTPTSTPAICADLLKLLRTQTMTRAQICEATGLSHITVDKWCKEFEQQGVFRASERASRTEPFEYWLSSSWGGLPR